MELQFLIGIMGTLTVVTTYFWVGRAEPFTIEQAPTEPK